MRVNALDSGLTNADLDVVMQGGPDGIVQPKPLGGADLQHLSNKIAVREAENNLPDGATRVIVITDRDRWLALPHGQLCRREPPPCGSHLGRRGPLRRSRRRDLAPAGRHLHAALCACTNLALFAAHAARVQAIDTVYPNFRDEAGFRRECEAARRDGFTGKMAIHPAQVSIINEVFTPPEAGSRAPAPSSRRSRAEPDAASSASAARCTTARIRARQTAPGAARLGRASTKRRVCYKPAAICCRAGGVNLRIRWPAIISSRTSCTRGKQDAIRSKLFSKLAREITVAAKMGLPDPAMNARLRAAVIAARAENMPKDNIERAIKKASGADAENYDEVRYEGYAPGGVAVIVEALTDNRNRTAGEVRSYFTKAGGSLAETGAVSFMFDRVGLIEFDAQGRKRGRHAGGGARGRRRRRATSEDGHEIITSLESLRDVAEALEAKFGEPRKAALVWRPQNTISVDDEAGEKILKLVGALEDNDDVQNVYANFEVSDALVAKMGA